MGTACASSMPPNPAPAHFTTPSACTKHVSADRSRSTASTMLFMAMGVLENRRSRLPNSPAEFEPQQAVAWVARIAHVADAPGTTLTTSARPPTASGVALRNVAVDEPSWPYRLSPQHLTVVSTRTAQLCDVPAEPAEIDTAETRALTVTGDRDRVVDVLIPNCPKSLRPQQRAVPSARIAHEWLPEEATRVAVVMPVAATGTLEFVVDPLPR